MPGPILCRQAKRQAYCGHWQMGHNMLYVPDLIFHSRDCIISVQSRKNGKHSGWNICGGTIRSDLHITMRETPNGDPLCGMLYCTVRGQTSAWKRGRPSIRGLKRWLIGLSLTHDTIYLCKIVRRRVTQEEKTWESLEL